MQRTFSLTPAGALQCIRSLLRNAPGRRPGAGRRAGAGWRVGAGRGAWARQQRLGRWRRAVGSAQGKQAQVGAARLAGCRPVCTAFCWCASPTISRATHFVGVGRLQLHHPRRLGCTQPAHITEPSGTDHSQIFATRLTRRSPGSSRPARWPRWSHRRCPACRMSCRPRRRSSSSIRNCLGSSRTCTVG